MISYKLHKDQNDNHFKGEQKNLAQLLYDCFVFLPLFQVVERNQITERWDYQEYRMAAGQALSVKWVEAVSNECGTDGVVCTSNEIMLDCYDHLLGIAFIQKACSTPGVLRHECYICIHI